MRSTKRNPEDIARLYHLLGAPMKESPEALLEGPFMAASAAERKVARPHLDPADLPPLSPDEVEALEQLLSDHPEETMERARRAFDTSLTPSELAARLARARKAMNAPAAAEALVRAERVFEADSALLPPEFDFDGMDLASIPIDPGNTKFEELADFLGWIVNTGRFAFGSPTGPKASFPWHDAPGSSTRFVYPLHGQAPGTSMSIALFADFGTGLYHSRYIARQIGARRFPYAIHLGDVYYAGREAEFKAYFKAPLDPLLGHTRLFTMNGNHEMFSLGVPFFRYIKERRAKSPIQEQEGSYFCLRGQTAQIIGIDTDYFGYRRYREPALLAWLEAQLQHGRANSLTNIVLSGDEPYEYGSSGHTALLNDLRSLVVDRQLIDLWFWGNTHYCALFDRAPGLPFIGSCIGHGGFPYGRQKPNATSPAPVRFLETKARFPEWTRLRQDRGNNGYCILDLRADGNLRLTYVDWMAHDRAIVHLPRSGDGRLTVGHVEIL